MTGTTTAPAAGAEAEPMEMVGADWPSVRDAMFELGFSAVHVMRLIHRQRIRAVKTRVGYLIDPGSLAAFEAERAQRHAQLLQLRAKG